MEEENKGCRTNIAIANEELRLKILELLPNLKNKEELSQQLLELIFPYQHSNIQYHNIFDKGIEIIATSNKKKTNNGSRTPTTVSFRCDEQQILYFDQLWDYLPRYYFKDKGDYHRAVHLQGALMMSMIVKAQIESGDVSASAFTIPEPLEKMEMLIDSQNKYNEAMKLEHAKDLARDYGEAKRMGEQAELEEKDILDTLISAMEGKQNIYKFSGILPKLPFSESEEA